LLIGGCRILDQVTFGLGEAYRHGRGSAFAGLKARSPGGRHTDIISDYGNKLLNFALTDYDKAMTSADRDEQGSTAAPLTVADLAGVVYSSGKVFDGLSTGRLDTENFLRSGSLEGISSRADLALLHDLRDAAQFVIDHCGRPIDAAFVRSVNATITRSGALHPGQLRTQAQSIGVATPYGRHTPDALTDQELQALIDKAMRGTDVRDNALDLFVDLATAQPFEDANKRTAVFVANSLLLGAAAGVVLTIPVDDDDPSLARQFNDLLARAYIYGERDGVKAQLRNRGLVPLGPPS